MEFYTYLGGLMAKQKQVEVSPDPARTAEALRGFGYQFDAALCDLIDNSIEAEATTISVIAHLDDTNQAFVTIVDDGNGMDVNELQDAMRIGAAEKEDEHRLGKFGFGLKTASTAFTASFTVVSRKKAKNSSPVASTYDVEKIVKENKWVIDLGDPTAEQLSNFEDDLSDLEELKGSAVKNGTVVYWDKVDRLLVTKTGDDFASARAGINRKIKEANALIGLVFHRFLDHKDKRAPNVNVYINGAIVKPYDPFVENFSQDVQTEPLIEQTIQVARSGADDAVGEVTVRGFLLPEPGSAEGLTQGSMRWSNANQGFYCYRENRLVDGPDWFDLYTSDTHTNAARIEISFTEGLDETFGLSVTKDSLAFPAGFREFMDEVAAPVRREANAQSRRKAEAKRTAARTGGLKKSDTNIQNQLINLKKPDLETKEDGSVEMANNTDNPVEVIDANGESPLVLVLPEDTNAISVSYEELDYGLLWQPAIGDGKKNIKVVVNPEHPWYRKSYPAELQDTGVTESIEYLLFALSMAESLNVDLFLLESFEQFRRDVSENLRVLVKELDEPDA